MQTIRHENKTTRRQNNQATIIQRYTNARNATLHDYKTTRLQEYNNTRIHVYKNSRREEHSKRKKNNIRNKKGIT